MGFLDFVLLLAAIPGFIMLSSFVDDIYATHSNERGSFLYWISDNMMFWVGAAFYILVGFSIFIKFLCWVF